MKTRKLKSFKHNPMPAKKMVMRIVDVRREDQDQVNKSVPVVIASENPVERYDDSTDEMIQEILLMSGVEYRAGKNQLPIVDSHDRSTVRNVLGSVRNIRVEGTELVGDASFARDTDSQIAFEKLMDGHLTDFSITAWPNEQRAIRRGETERIGDKEIQGPAVIVTRWTPSDASLVAAGADETSTVRELLRSYQIKPGVKRAMDEKLRNALIEKGMPEQIEDIEEALNWAIELVDSLDGESEEIQNENEDEKKMIESEDKDKIENEEQEEEDEEEREEDKDEVEHAVKRALQRDKKRRSEIKALCRQAKLSTEYADQLCESGASVNQSRSKVLKRMIEKQKPVGSSGESARVVGEGREQLIEAMGAGLVQRCFRSANLRNQTPDKQVKGSEQFEQLGMLRMAEAILRHDGVDTMRLTPQQIAHVAMGHRPTIERLKNSNIIRSAYHTTGSFANLLLDAANKTLLRAYDEAPYTWSTWARQAPSVSDFKDINRIRFSESPDLLMVPENDKYPEGEMSDSKETYKVEKFGRLFTVTWETVVNDDLDAISRIPQMHGNAARRTQNKLVYQVLTSNPLMGDANALFSASHASGSNLSGSASDPNVANLNTAFAAMMKQKGLNTDVIINVQPRYLIVPVALSATALQLVGSIADPGAGGSAAGNANTLNIYGPNGSRPIQVVAEPQLDAASTTAWYLAADTGQIDTVELSFLQGEEQPVLENEWDFEKDVYKFKVRQTFGAKAIDWRGLYKFATA